MALIFSVSAKTFTECTNTEQSYLFFVVAVIADFVIQRWLRYHHWGGLLKSLLPNSNH